MHRRRIYVLPTRFGLAYSCVLVVMLLGALNYNNNPAMLLTCLIAAAIAFAREGANVLIAYLNEHEEAREFRA